MSRISWGHVRGRDRGAGAPACRRCPEKRGERALDGSRGGFSTKIHVRVERGGKPIVQTLRREITAWHQRRNARGGRVDWRFTTADARIKLKRLYPSFAV